MHFIVGFSILCNSIENVGIIWVILENAGIIWAICIVLSQILVNHANPMKIRIIQSVIRDFLSPVKIAKRFESDSPLIRSITITHDYGHRERRNCVFLKTAFGRRGARLT